MCGLAGVISSYISPGEAEIFQNLSLMATLRGKFGGGLVVVPVSEKKDFTILRSDETLAHLTLGGEFYDLALSSNKKKKTPCVIMGHARFPTVGSFEAVHPHCYAPIIGMHNGTFKKVAGRGLDKGESDSAVFFKDVASVGIKSAIQRAEGAYALAWVNEQQQTISFLRNKDRPLFFGTYEGFEGTWWWCSEAEMLSYVLNRERSSKLKNTKVVIKELPVDTILTTKLRNNGNIHFKFTPCKRVETGVPVIPFLPALPPPQELSRKGPTEFTSSGRVSEPPRYVQEELGLDVGESAYQPLPGKWCTREELMRLLASGCANCGQKASLEDYYSSKGLYWYETTTLAEFICGTCYDNDSVARSYVHSHQGKIH